jgi:chaperonin GroES
VHSRGWARDPVGNRLDYRKGNQMKLKPLSDRIIVQRLDAETTTPGGIILPDQSQEKPLLGHVVAVGPGKRHERWEATRIEMDVKQGDLVLFSKYGGHSHRLDGREEVVILKEEDVLCIIEREATDFKAVG